MRPFVCVGVQDGHKKGHTHHEPNNTNNADYAVHESSPLLEDRLPSGNTQKPICFPFINFHLLSQVRNASVFLKRKRLPGLNPGKGINTF
jgi:hypothetical protein